MDEKQYCVVRISTENDFHVSVISNTWLLNDNRLAAIPNVPPYNYYQAVREHRFCYGKQRFSHARLLEVSYSATEFPEASCDSSHTCTPSKLDIRELRPLLPEEDGYDPPIIVTKLPNLPVTMLMRRLVSAKCTDSASSLGSMQPDEEHRFAYQTAEVKTVWTDHDNVQNKLEVMSGSQQHNSTTPVCLSLTATDTQDVLSTESLALYTELFGVLGMFGLFETDIAETMLSNQLKMETDLAAMQTAIRSMSEAAIRCTAPPDSSLPLPVTTVAELEMFDDDLKDEQRKQQFDVNETTRLMLERIMPRSVAAQINFSGANKTFAFRKTLIYTVLKSVLLHRFVEVGTTPAHVANTVKGWLHTVRHSRPKRPSKVKPNTRSEVYLIVDLNSPSTVGDFQEISFTQN
ncbi:unnamed protein product [Dicrocoelium dendriticum]|nr:unnamed protein product [Dicrocoelium dendriticum]